LQLAFCQWLEGFFLDIDPQRGLAPGEQWQLALRAVAEFPGQFNNQVPASRAALADSVGNSEDALCELLSILRSTASISVSWGWVHAFNV
jgi:hypothetical protein